MMLATHGQISDNNGFDPSRMTFMDQLIEFVGNNLLLSGLFAAVAVAWIFYEISRKLRKWHELGTLEAVQIINRQEPLIVDVSNSSDYAKGHIAGALHLPPSQLEAGDQRLDKYRDRPVLIYCKNGQVSPQMATRLTRKGFGQVYVLNGGLAQWISDQQPVTRHKGAARNAPGGKGKRKNRRQADKTGTDA